MSKEEVVVYEPPKVALSPKRSNYELSIGNYNTTLVRDVDFGKIPNTKTPTLFKAGAEKVLAGMGLNYDVEITDSYKDYANGFFYYECMAKAYYNGQVVRVGVGCCNTNENGFGMAKGFSSANSALKKSRKRAIVDLALTIACLSDAFTQDMEDETNEQRMKHIQSEEEFINSKQSARLFSIASSYEITKEKAKDFLATLGYDSSSKIKVKDYDDVVNKIKEYGENKK